MSVKAVGWALEQNLPPAEKIVLVALADCENGSTLRCDPSQKYLATLSSLSERTVRTIVQTLEEKSLIRRTRVSDTGRRGGRRSDSYRLGLRGFEPEDIAGTPTGKSEGGNRQAVAGTEEPEGTGSNTDGPVPEVTTEPVDNQSGTGPGITPATVSATAGHPLHYPSVFAAIGSWLLPDFTDGDLDVLADEILAKAPTTVLDRTGYVIRAIRNTAHPSERNRGHWLLRADEIVLERRDRDGRAF